MADRGARIADEELLRIVHTGDPISAMHRDIVGSAVRLHIPLKDVETLRRAAKALRVAASAIEQHCMAREETWRIALRCRSAVDEAQLVICPDYGKKGRRRRA